MKNNIRHPKSKNRMPWLLPAMLILLVLPSWTGAAESQPITLGSVLVTAASPDETSRVGDVDTETTPVFHTVIKREEFEGRMESLAEVVEKEAGVQIRQQGGLGGYSAVSLRGSSSNQVLVFIDGILLNDGAEGSVNLSNISLADVEAIEIYRGITPANFNRSSIGGLINIRTLRSKKDFSAAVTAGAGSFGTRRLSGFVNHKPGRADYILSLDYLGSQNDFTIDNDNNTIWNPDDDREENRNNNELTQFNGLAKAGFDFSDRFRADISTQWFHKDEGLPNWNNSPLVDTSLTTRRSITSAQISGRRLGSLGCNLSLSADYTWKEEEYDDRHGYVGLGSQHSIYTTKRKGAGFFFELPAGRHLISLNADFHTEDYDPEDLLTRVNPHQSSRDTVSLALQDSIFLCGDRLIITPAVRQTSIKDDLQSATSIWGLPLEGRTREESYLTPQLGLKYQAARWLALKANAAGYVREPGFHELFGDRGYLTGNPDLEAEKGTNFDLGFEADWSPAGSVVRRVSFHGAYFRNSVEDIITWVYDSRGIGRAMNFSEAFIEGFETGLNIDVAGYLGFILNATWLDTENRSEISGYNGKYLPGRFRTSYLGRIEIRPRPFKIYGELIVEDGMYYDASNLLKASKKEELNFGVSWAFKSTLWTLEIKNAGDSRYEDFNGYPSPGRSFFLTMKYSL